MTLTPTELDIVESLAQEHIKYQIIWREQREVLQKDQVRYAQAIEQAKQSPIIAKPGQCWRPTPDKVDEYLAQCDAICRSIPHTFEDRVKIMIAAHAGLMCVASCKFGQQPEHIQLEIMKKHHEKSLSLNATTTPGSCKGPRPPTIMGNSERLLSRPLVDPRQITEEDLKAFEIPDHLHGKQFILNGDEPCMYEVIGYSRKRDKTITYDVLFEDWEDPVTIDEKEMKGMLADSLFFAA